LDFVIVPIFGERKYGYDSPATIAARLPRASVPRQTVNVGVEAQGFTIPNTTGTFGGIILSYRSELLRIVFSKEYSLYEMYFPISNTAGSFFGVSRNSMSSRRTRL
jgi:hypothetical protein